MSVQPSRNGAFLRYFACVLPFLLQLTTQLPVALGDDYELIDAAPSMRTLERHHPLDFSWQLNNKVDTVELRLYRIEGGQPVLVDSANLPGYRTSLREFGGTLTIGKYQWDLIGYFKNSAVPVFTKTTTFTIEPHNPNNAEFAKVGIMLGYSQGEYSSINVDFGLAYRSSRSLYGAFFEIPTFDARVYFKGAGYVQEYNVLGEFTRVTAMYFEAAYAFKYMGQRLRVLPGFRFSYYYIPEIQYGEDQVGNRINVYGQTNAWTIGPSLSICYGITRDWFAQIDFVAERQFKSFGTISRLGTPSTDLTYSADAMLRGLWFWPFELGFRAGYRKLALGQDGATTFNRTSLVDVRFSVQLAYLFGFNL